MTNIKQKDCPECKDLPEGEVVKGHDHRNVISKTYTEMAEEWCEIRGRESVTEENHEPFPPYWVIQFGKYLDTMPYLFPHLELLAMRKSREIDKEIFDALIEALGHDKAVEVIRPIHMRHKRT